MLNAHYNKEHHIYTQMHSTEQSSYEERMWISLPLRSVSVAWTNSISPEPALTSGPSSFYQREKERELLLQLSSWHCTSVCACVCLCVLDFNHQPLQNYSRNTRGNTLQFWPCQKHIKYMHAKDFQLVLMSLISLWLLFLYLI